MDKPTEFYFSFCNKSYMNWRLKHIAVTQGQQQQHAQNINTSFYCPELQKYGGNPIVKKT
jgi:hypothetical protein